LTPVINLSPESVPTAETLLPVSLTPVINHGFITVIDIGIVIDTDDKFMTKVVDNRLQFVTGVVGTDDKCATGDVDSDM